MKKLGFGTMRLPLLDAEDAGSIDYEKVNQMVDAFLEAGFTYFDTAYPYHDEKSEGAVRRCLTERYPRERFQLADKMPIIKVKAPEDYQRFFDEQLERCGVSYFDVYLLHNMGVDRYAKTLEFGGFDFLKGLKERGQAKKIGFSFHDTAALLDQILTAHPEVDVVQLQINYLDWDSEVAQSGACYDVAVKHGKQVIVMEPVKGGVLANLPEKAAEVMNRCTAAQEKDPAQVSAASYAIRFAASLEQVCMVLSGMSEPAQMADNLSYMADFQPLNDGEKAMLKECAAIINAATAVPCTSCKYCLEECPISVNIPAYFGLLNLYKTLEKKTNMYYQRAAFGYAKASECLKCGKCEKICPQHIKIRDHLEAFADLYEH